MKLDSAEKLFIDELKDLYSAEKQITRALPKMSKAAASPELKEAFQLHLEQTKGQIERLNRAFEILGKSAGGKTCQGMQGLLTEATEIMEETEGDIRDVAMIAAAQKVEHYEIAGYGSVRSLAELMGQTEIAQLLQQTLSEEGETDKKLTQIAKKVNRKAQKQAA